MNQNASHAPCPSIRNSSATSIYPTLKTLGDGCQQLNGLDNIERSGNTTIPFLNPLHYQRFYVKLCRQHRFFTRWKKLQQILLRQKNANFFVTPFVRYLLASKIHARRSSVFQMGKIQFRPYLGDCLYRRQSSIPGISKISTVRTFPTTLDLHRP